MMRSLFSCSLGFLLLSLAYSEQTLQHYSYANGAEFCCYYFHNETVSMFSHEYYTHYNPTTICQYNIDVTEPDNLVDNCDLVLCFKDLNLDAGDFIKINHRDLQVTYGGDNLPNYPLRIWDHKVSFWFSSDSYDYKSEAKWALTYRCLERGVDHDLCNICDELNELAVLPEDETENWYRIWS